MIDEQVQNIYRTPFVFAFLRVSVSSCQLPVPLLARSSKTSYSYHCCYTLILWFLPI
jgi:hypothetical protein